MHLHAVPTDIWGEIGAPNAAMGGPSKALGEKELMNLTLSIMLENNIVLGFVSGSMELIAKWKMEAPDKFIASPFSTFFSLSRIE